jgi:N-acetylneuraminate synthase/sialic acid synthase
VRSLTIAGRRIADDEPAYVVAELGHNHGGSTATAVQMIQAAAACGVSAVKLQKRDNETLYSQTILNQPYENENSFGATYGAHRAALEFDEQGYAVCQHAAKQAGVPLFATAFDEPSLAFLVERGVPAIKLASGSLTDAPLLSMAGACGLPVILSTGGGTWRDIDNAVDLLYRRTTEFALLHCTAAYPVLDFAELNLRCISKMRERYTNTVIGWSGHDSGIAMSTVAYTLGASIIEKHFTLNRASKGTDHAFSIEPSGMKKLCRDLSRTRVALGDGIKRIYPSEVKPMAKMRRTEQDGVWQIRAASEVKVHV